MAPQSGSCQEEKWTRKVTVRTPHSENCRRRRVLGPRSSSIGFPQTSANQSPSPIIFFWQRISIPSRCRRISTNPSRCTSCRFQRQSTMSSVPTACICSQPLHFCALPVNILDHTPLLLPSRVDCPVVDYPYNEKPDLAR